MKAQKQANTARPNQESKSLLNNKYENYQSEFIGLMCMDQKYGSKIVTNIYHWEN